MGLYFFPFLVSFIFNENNESAIIFLFVGFGTLIIEQQGMGDVGLSDIERT